MVKQPPEPPPIFDWDRYRDYVSAMTGAEEELIKRHFNQLGKDNDWDDLDLNKLEMESKFDDFRHGWILARMFTDDKLKLEAII